MVGYPLTCRAKHTPRSTVQSTAANSTLGSSDPADDSLTCIMNIGIGLKCQSVKKNVILIVTAEKPDICIVNKTTNEVTILELTVPFEDRMDISNRLKDAKYEKLVSDLSETHSVGFEAFEVGSRGWISKTNQERLKDIHGFCKQVESGKAFIQNIGELALLSSYYIQYLSRKEVEWEEPIYLTPRRKLNKQD